MEAFKFNFVDISYVLVYFNLLSDSPHCFEHLFMCSQRTGYFTSPTKE